MHLDQLAIEYYHSSLSLAQKALIAGLTIAGISHLVSMVGGTKPSYKIPFINIEVVSFSYFSISLIILFVVCGIVCSFGVHKALDNWKLVSEKNIALRLLHVPSVFMLGSFFEALQYGFFIGAGASLFEGAFKLRDWHTLVLGSIIALPYLGLHHVLGSLKINKATIKPLSRQPPE